MPMVNPSPEHPRLLVAWVMVVSMSGGAARAQPADIIDLGDRTGGEVLAVPVWLAHPRAVQWYRIQLPSTGAVAAPDGFVDLYEMPSVTQAMPMFDCSFAIFDRSGSRLAISQDVSDWFLGQLSFGASDPRAPIPSPPSPSDPPDWPNPPFRGQDGPLAAGEYWVSVANHATYGPGPWEVGSNANPANNQRATILYFNIQPTGVHYCDGDFNWDGSADQDDVMYLANVLTGGENPTGRWADFNRDGNEDQDDLLALVHTIAGGGCP